MATIKDIARELNIGVSTVSMALNNHPSINEKTKERVVETARKLGYVKNGVAVDLRRKKTNLILLVVDDASRPFFSRVIDAAQRRVAYYGYDLLIATTFHDSTQTARRYISEYRADAAIVFTPRIEDDFIAQYASKKFPIFGIAKKIETDNKYCLGYNGLDYLSGDGHNPVEYLIEMGHKKIVFVKGKTNHGVTRRYANYLRTLEQNNIPFDNKLVFEAQHSTMADGYQVTKDIVHQLGTKMDAILYANDDLALGGLEALREQNINVPGDISVMGHNNLILSELSTPKLTTFSGAEFYSTTYAVDIIMKILDGKEVTKEEIDKYSDKIYREQRVVERESVRRRN